MNIIPSITNINILLFSSSRVWPTGGAAVAHSQKEVNEAWVRKWKH